MKSEKIIKTLRNNETNRSMKVPLRFWILMERETQGWTIIRLVLVVENA